MNETQDSHGVISAKLGARDSRKVGNNTYLKKLGDGSIALRLHATDILTFFPDGHTVAKTGGWKTATTKARLNEWLPHGFAISQRSGVWFWSKYHEGTGWKEGPVFTDGDIVTARGTVDYETSEDPKGAEQLKLRRQIKKYAKLCADAVPLPPPGPGDCWGCLLKTKNGERVLGHGTDHYREHIKEGYVVPSLVADALREAGNTSLVIAGAFKQEGQDTSFLTGIAKTRVRQAVAQFLYRQFGLCASGGWGNRKAA